MLATKCGAGNKVSTRLHQHEDDEEGREVLGRAREKEGYFPFRKMLRRARVSTCARATGVCASLDPSLPFGPKRKELLIKPEEIRTRTLRPEISKPQSVNEA
jgi:hypothetical protein